MQSKWGTALLTVLLVIIAPSTAQAQAQTDLLASLFIEGYEFNREDPYSDGSIEVLGYTVDIGGTVHLETPTNELSDKLFQACDEGTIIPEAALVVKSDPFHVSEIFVFKRVVVAYYHIGDVGWYKTDRFALNFENMEYLKGSGGVNEPPPPDVTPVPTLDWLGIGLLMTLLVGFAYCRRKSVMS